MLREYLQDKYNDYILFISYSDYESIYDEDCELVKQVCTISNKLSSNYKLNLTICSNILNRNTPYVIHSAFKNHSITIKDLKTIISLFDIDDSLLDDIKCFKSDKLQNLNSVIVDDSTHSIILIIN